MEPEVSRLPLTRPVHNKQLLLRCAPLTLEAWAHTVECEHRIHPLLVVALGENDPARSVVRTCVCKVISRQDGCQTLVRNSVDINDLPTANFRNRLKIN